MRWGTWEIVRTWKEEGGGGGVSETWEVVPEDDEATTFESVEQCENLLLQGNDWVSCTGLPTTSLLIAMLLPIDIIGVAKLASVVTLRFGGRCWWCLWRSGGQKGISGRKKWNVEPQSCPHAEDESPYHIVLAPPRQETSEVSDSRARTWQPQTQAGGRRRTREGA